MTWRDQAKEAISKLGLIPGSPTAASKFLSANMPIQFRRNSWRYKVW